MLSTTAADILSRARARADAETASPTTDFTPTTELLGYLRDSYRRLVDKLIRLGGATRLLVTYLDLTAPSYSLPADFYLAVAVDLPVAEGRYVPLRQFNFQERNDYFETTRPRWRVVNGVIKLSPSDSAPATIRFWYIPDGGTISDSADTVSAFNGWDEWLVNDIAMKILTKEDRETGAVRSLRDEVFLDMRSILKNSARAGVRTIADTRQVTEDYYDLL